MDSVSSPDSIAAIVLRLTMAAALGGAVGLNREVSGKPAGLRTHALVSIGAGLATLVGLLLSAWPDGDPSAAGRIVQGLIAGIGFLGGGVILRSRASQEIHGLTTAASIWIASTLGAAAGAGLWRSAAVATALTLLVLVVGGPLDRAIHKRGRADHL